jgi:hypothetical protein
VFLLTDSIRQSDRASVTEKQKGAVFEVRALLLLLSCGEFLVAIPLPQAISMVAIIQTAKSANPKGPRFCCRSQASPDSQVWGGCVFECETAQTR